MTRLVVVSNRVANTDQSAQTGGLVVALGDALREKGGLWFGWNGTVTDAQTANRIDLDGSGPYDTATVSLTEEEHRTYYTGMANNLLWPVLHYRLDLARLDAGYLQGYRQVNSRFADCIRSLLQPTDFIWVHDYHLIPFGAELRARGCANAIGFFLHIPFPPPDMLVALPGHEWLVRSMFAYDVVGFQTSSDLANFQRYVTENADGKLDVDGRLTAFGRTIVVKAFPIGIDVDTFREMARTPEADLIVQRMHRRNVEAAQIIGVDRLDYTKGLPERFIAFEKLLEQYPEHSRNVNLMQIAPPTREDVDAYADIRQSLERLSGAVNGRFANFDWTPIRYIHRNVSRATLAALFRGSRIGLVTPLRDGMNLVAKEYIAAQDDENPGVLVLSKFAGAAEDLQEALQVNPYDAYEVAGAMQRGLVMPLEERRERQDALLNRIRARDARHWRRDFVAHLRSVPAAGRH